MMLKKMKNGLEVEYSPSNPLSNSDPAPAELNRRTVVLAKGSVHADGAFPLPCDIIADYDQPIPMRDDVRLYADIFRPAGAGKVPALLVYTPYCKRGGWWNEHFNATKFGVSPSSLSGLQAFEAPDPGFWCDHGYAIVVVDAAGTTHSEGDQPFMGTASAERVFDAIEHVAGLDWCSGRIGMAGNSQLGMIQWAVGALRPPHLAAIAPWEGLTDQYREVTLRGGILDMAFHDQAIAPFIFGKTDHEDILANSLRFPLMNAYWEDKRPALDRIDIPAYVVASWTSPIHARGTLEGYRKISSKKKWLRVHNTQEWLDLADPANIADLKKFFDYYLKDIQNNWEETPKVRLSVLDPGHEDIVNRPEAEWPLARQQWQKLHLDAAAGRLTKEAPEKGVAEYVSDDVCSSVRFVMEADRDMEITGYLNLHLWVEAPDADDLDLFAAVYKEDANGKRLHHITLSSPGARQWVESLEVDGTLPSTLSYTGPVGRVRVSHRALDPDLSTPDEPVLSHREEQRVPPGTIVPVNLSLWPTSMLVHAGESLVVEIAGHVTGPLTRKGLLLPGTELTLETRNRGRHRIHSGGEYDSFLQLPLIPQAAV